jgi:hypothetical protein
MLIIQLKKASPAVFNAINNSLNQKNEHLHKANHYLNLSFVQ